MEHIIFKHISSFLEEHNLVDSRQHGFRRGVSTVTQLIEAVHDFAAALDKQSQIDIIFLDFEKAFDCVSHPKLLLKLRTILKNDTLLAWIAAYLSCRGQCVGIDGVCSSYMFVQSGVPQGSVLGPLFFLVFINDIVSVVPVKIKLFADDCIIYQEIKNSNDQSQLNFSLAQIENWCSTWQMKINRKKTVTMTVTRKRKPLLFPYSVNGHPLSSVKSCKYLGVILTSDLRWNEHVSYITKKAMQKLGYMRRTLRNSTQEIKLLAFKTFIRPVLEYASVVWDPCTQLNIAKLESIQKKAARFIYNSYSWRTSATALVEKANLEPLQLRRYFERMKYMHLLYNSKLGIDSSIYIEHVIRRCTRSNHSKKLKEYMCRTDTFQNSFFPRTVRQWNALPCDAVECPTVESFLSKLKCIS